MEKTPMLDLSKEKWKVLDKSVEEFENEYIRIIRPINDEAISIDCPECQSLLGDIEDIETYKRHKMCKNCELDNWTKLYNK